MIDFRPDPTAGYLYEQMANHLSARIRAGELTHDTPLPSEYRLAHEYNVSLGTARHATRLLRFRGLVTTLRSKGTYVTYRQPMPAPELGYSPADSKADPDATTH